MKVKIELEANDNIVNDIVSGVYDKISDNFFSKENIKLIVEFPNEDQAILSDSEGLGSSLYHIKFNDGTEKNIGNIIFAVLSGFDLSTIQNVVFLPTNKDITEKIMSLLAEKSLRKAKEELLK